MGDITCIDFVGVGSQIISGATDNTVRLWNCGDQKQITQFGKLGLAQMNQISLINDNKILLTSSSDGKFSFYDISSGKCIIEINGCNGNSVESHSILNNKNCVILGSDNGICYIYDIRKLDKNNINCITTIQRDERSIKKIIKCNGNKLILYNQEGSIWKWNIDINKNIDNVNKVNTSHEWTGNQQFGINDVVLMNDDNNIKKLFVATKNYQIKEYDLL